MTFRSFGSLAVVCATLAGCGDGSGLLGVAGAGNAASVRFVNASATTLDLATGGNVAAGNANILPGSSVGCFAVADPTVPSLSVRQAGSLTDLAGFTTSFASGGRYTLVAFPGPSGLVQFISVPTPFSPLAGRSALRVLNASAGLPLVDVYATAPGAPLVTPVATAVGFGSAPATFDVAAGSIQVRLTTAGTTTLVYDAGNQALLQGRSYTLIVTSATAALLVEDCI